MILDEEDIQEITKDGAKVRGDRGTALAAIKPKVEPGSLAMMSLLKQMIAALEGAVTKQAPSPEITLRPTINVSPSPAPEVTVQNKGYRVWDLVVTERDSANRIKRMQFKAED